MGTFVPPASLGSVAPPSPAQGVVIGSNDQLTFDYIIGKTIIAGSQFSDTLGRFFPFEVDPSKSLVISGSDTNVYGIRFHNTAAVVTDGVIYMSNGGVIFVVPNQSTGIGNLALFAVADRAASGYMGYLFYPGYAGGPRIYFNDGTNVNLVHSSGANYISITGASAGFSPSIVAAGVGTNVGITLTPKGTGATYFSNQFANYTYAWGANAGTAASFGVIGSDTNIDLILSPQGTGVLYLLYASTALGGGAAPTLGTIGGSGPANAAQAAWGKLKFNGTTYFVPLWT